MPPPRMEMIPKALVVGVLAAVQPTPAPVATEEKLNRIWAEVAPLHGYRQLQIAPDASGAMFLGATSDDGVTIQLLLLQVRSGIRMGTTATAADEAVDVLKAIRGQGNAVLQGSTHAPAFDWFGSAEEILVRLRSLPEDGGPEMIRSEFA